MVVTLILYPNLLVEILYFLVTLDNDVQAWICSVRVNGGVINSRTVMAGAEAIVTKFARHKLQRHGGHINITKTFAISILRRMGFVKRKGTKGVNHLPADLDSIKEEYVNKVNNVIKEHNIPDSLVINWDQTGCQLVPGGDWTMEQQRYQRTQHSRLISNQLGPDRQLDY